MFAYLFPLALLSMLTGGFCLFTGRIAWLLWICLSLFLVAIVLFLCSDEERVSMHLFILSASALFLLWGARFEALPFRNRPSFTIYHETKAIPSQPNS